MHASSSLGSPRPRPAQVLGVRALVPALHLVPCAATSRRHGISGNSERSSARCVSLRAQESLEDRVARLAPRLLWPDAAYSRFQPDGTFFRTFYDTGNNAVQRGGEK